MRDGLPTWRLLSAPTVACLVMVMVWPADSQNFSSGGKLYGPWYVRQNQKFCRTHLFCEYRKYNCMVVVKETQWECTKINDNIKIRGCKMRMCDGVCAMTSPGPDYVQVISHSCGIGTKCFKSANPTTQPSAYTTANPTTRPPDGTTANPTILPPDGTTPNPTTRQSDDTTPNPTTQPSGTTQAAASDPNTTTSSEYG